MKKTCSILFTIKNPLHAAGLGILYYKEHCMAQADQSTILILTLRTEPHAVLVTRLTPREL